MDLRPTLQQDDDADAAYAAYARARDSFEAVEDQGGLSVLYQDAHSRYVDTETEFYRLTQVAVPADDEGDDDVDVAEGGQ